MKKQALIIILLLSLGTGFSLKAQTPTTYSILSTAYDRSAGSFMFPGDLDIYWLLTEMQDLVVPLNPSSLLTFPEDPTYVVTNSGNNNFPGIISDRSINYEPTTTSNGLKIITYRTYFDLPDLSTTTNGYSLTFKLCADDAVDNVKLNGTKKGQFLSPTYHNIPGIDKPYLLNIPVCDTSFRSGQNFIDVTIADAGGSIGFYAEISLFETTGACTPEVGIKEYNKQNPYFSIYPNPSDESTSIHLNHRFAADIAKSTTVNIYSVDGKLIQTATVEKPELDHYMINTKHLTNGMYYVNITSGTYSQHLKFIKE